MRDPSVGLNVGNFTIMLYTERAGSPKTVGILDLSRELRDKIYRELLIRPTDHAAATRRHKFETSVLRVNKQIHREASKVLYEENAWVVFEMRCHGLTRDLTTDRDLIMFIRVSGELPFGGDPSLRVCVQDHDLRDRETRDFVIVPLEWVGDLTEAFIQGDKTHKFEFAVHYTESMKHESRQRMTMEFLEIIRGVRKANITGLTPPSLGAQLAEHMMTPMKSIDELIDRTSEYMRRAELMLAQGQFYLAEELYNHGYNNSIWATGSRFLERLPDYSHTKIRILDSKLCESLAGSAVCCIRHGDSRAACSILKSYILGNTDLPESQRATGFYYHGLALVAEGVENEALFAFTQALILHPGYEAVDSEIDALEERVTKGMSIKVAKALILENVISLEQFRICWNLDLVEPSRHRNAGDQELSQQQDQMLAEFKLEDVDLRTFLAI